MSQIVFSGFFDFDLFFGIKLLISSPPIASLILSWTTFDSNVELGIKKVNKRPGTGRHNQFLIFFARKRSKTNFLVFSTSVDAVLDKNYLLHGSIADLRSKNPLYRLISFSFISVMQSFKDWIELSSVQITIQWVNNTKTYSVIYRIATI